MRTTMTDEFPPRFPPPAGFALFSAACLRTTNRKLPWEIIRDFAFCDTLQHDNTVSMESVSSFFTMLARVDNGNLAGVNGL